MSKYDILKGLVKEILPTGEKVLVHEGDDLLRSLHGLDERMIENMVSKRDASNRAHKIKGDLRKSLYPIDEYSLQERRPLTQELSRKLDAFNGGDDILKVFDRINSPRTVGSYHFPEEFDKHINPDEIAELSKQYNASNTDFDDALLERKAIMDKLRESNPKSIYLQSYPSFDDFDEIADKRFKNIRASLKGE